VIGHKRRRRRRFWLLGLAVLPQAASLGIMGGMFWMVKIKDVLSVPADFSKESGRVHISFDVSPTDRPKLEAGGVVHGVVMDSLGEPGATFQAEVTEIRPKGPTSDGPAWRVTARLRPLRDQCKAGISSIVERGEPVSVRISTRTRRALSVVFKRSDISGMTRGVTSEGVGLGGNP
jgi:hypothetical protein